MKLDQLVEARQDFTDKNKWVATMKKAGVTEFLNEKEFNIDLIYAVVGDKLIGTWSPKKKEGFKYSGKGMSFDKRKRKFNKVKM